MNVPSAPVVYPKPKVAPDRLQFWWYPPESDGDSPILSYTLTCSAIGFSQTYSADTFWAGVSSGIVVGTTYTFSIYATNGVDDGPPASFIPVVPCFPPGPPTNLTSAFIGYDGIDVSWTPPVNTGGADLTYNLVTAYPISIDYGSIIKQSGPVPINSIYLSPLVSTLSYNVLVQTRNFNTYSPQNTFLPTLTYGTTPANVSTLSLWLDASDYAYLYSDSGATQPLNYGGGPISAWRDKSTSNNLLIAENSDYPSIHSVTGLHTLIPDVGLKYFPAIQTSSNTAQYMSGSLTASATNQLSIFCLFRWNQPYQGSSSNIFFELFDGNVRLNQFAGGLRVSCDGEAGEMNNFSADAVTSLFLLTATQTSTICSVLTPLVYQRQFSRNNAITFTTPTNIQTGRMTPDPDANVRTSELLLYGSTLTVAEQSDLYSYFRTKWKLSYADNKGTLEIVGPGAPYIVSTPYTFSIIYGNKEPVVYTVISDTWTVDGVSIGSSTTLTPGPDGSTIATKDTQFNITGSTTIGYSINTLEFGIINATPLTITVTSGTEVVSITMSRTPDTDVLVNQPIQFGSVFNLDGSPSMDFTSVDWDFIAPGDQNPTYAFTSPGVQIVIVTYNYITAYTSTITGINVLDDLSITADTNIAPLTGLVTFTLNNPDSIEFSSGDWIVDSTGQGTNVTPFVYSAWGTTGDHSINFAYTPNLDPSNPKTTNTETITVYDPNITIDASPISPATTSDPITFTVVGLPTDAIIFSHTWSIVGTTVGSKTPDSDTPLLASFTSLPADSYTVDYTCTLNDNDDTVLTATQLSYTVNSP